jgi:hypothetical protein
MKWDRVNIRVIIKKKYIHTVRETLRILPEVLPVSILLDYANTGHNSPCG